MTVDDLLERMSSVELSEWMAVYDREHQIAEAVHNGVSPQLAFQAIWYPDDVRRKRE